MLSPSSLLAHLTPARLPFPPPSLSPSPPLLKVWSKEPVRPEEYGSLILQNGLPNLICLPHVGASTEETAEQTCIEAVEILAAYLDGKGLANRVI